LRFGRFTWYGSGIATALAGREDLRELGRTVMNIKSVNLF